MRKFTIVILVVLVFVGCMTKSRTWEVYYQQSDLRHRIVDSLKKKLPDTGNSFARLLLDSTFTSPELCIVSGGQTGVEMAALAAARDMNIISCGWCLPNRRCDSGRISPDFHVFATPAERSNNAPDVERSLRMEWNVAMSDATLILRSDILKKLGPAAIWNIKCAERYHKEYVILDLRDTAHVQDQIKLWLSSHRQKLRIINIVGSRETDYNTGLIYNKAYYILSRTFHDLLSSNEYSSGKIVSQFDANNQ